MVSLLGAEVTDVDYSRDGVLIASASADKSIKATGASVEC